MRSRFVGQGYQSTSMGDLAAEYGTRPVVLDIDRLGKTFHSAKGKISALKDVSFRVRRKEFVSVIGPSGCGKTTTLRCVSIQHTRRSHVAFSTTHSSSLMRSRAPGSSSRIEIWGHACAISDLKFRRKTCFGRTHFLR